MLAGVIAEIGHGRPKCFPLSLERLIHLRPGYMTDQGRHWIPHFKEKATVLEFGDDRFGQAEG